MTRPPLILFNSQTRSLEPFVPLRRDEVRIYSCGPTVYHDPHLGNLRAYVFTDTLRRTLEHFGHRVRHVINITDVGHLSDDGDAGEDKLEVATARTGRTAWDVAEHYTRIFLRNLKALNIRTPHALPRATEYVTQMISFAERIAPAHAYRLESGLYFDVSTLPDYGRLATGGADIGTAPTEGRIAEVEGKRHPADFALWRATPPGETRQMEWDSPWGRGAPGWHLECSVMGEALLGFPFDIHTGGIDHREVHHPNEIAQNQAFCGGDPGVGTGARWWMHNNFLVDRGGKMSKSKGGFTTLERLTDAGLHPLAYRLMCLGAHYRSELDFSPEGVMASLVRLRRLVIAVSALKSQAAGAIAEHCARSTACLARFDAALADDLNLPAALPILDEVIADRQMSPAIRLVLIEHMDQVLGLELDGLDRAQLRLRPRDAALTEDQVTARIAERQAARAARDFATSDRIRAELADAGVEVMDGDPLGWDWIPKLR